MVIVNDEAVAKKLADEIVKEYESGLSYKEALKKVVLQYQKTQEHLKTFKESISQFKN